jgi:hypothetical protein
MGRGCDDVGPNCEELTSEESSCKSVALDCIYEEVDWDPVCMCTGEVRQFDCGYFSQTGFDHCDRIECGSETCDKATEYCEIIITAPYAADRVCKPLPTACGSAPSCGCMSAEPCGQQCQGAAETGFRLICPMM